MKKNLCQETVFQSFYQKHLKPLYHFLYFKTGSESESMDLAQEAFIKIWENCSKVAPEKAASYLYTTARNLFLNTVKHQQVILRYRKESDGEDRHSLTPEFLMEEEEFRQKLLQAIENLTDAQREVFLMNRIDGKKYKEIADTLDISVKAVEKRMTGALKSIREQLGDNTLQVG